MSKQLGINQDQESVSHRFALSAVNLYATLGLKDKKWSLDEKRVFIKNGITSLVKIAQEIMPLDDYAPSESILNNLDFNQSNDGNISFLLWYFRDADTKEKLEYAIKMQISILLRAVK